MDKTKYALFVHMELGNILISLHKLLSDVTGYLTPLHISHRGMTKRILSLSYPKHDTLQILSAENSDAAKQT